MKKFLLTALAISVMGTAAFAGCCTKGCPVAPAAPKCGCEKPACPACKCDKCKCDKCKCKKEAEKCCPKCHKTPCECKGK